MSMTTRRRTHRFLDTDGGFCLSSDGLSKAKACPRIVATLVTPWGRLDGRKFHAIPIADEMFLADAITGTLYELSGESVSRSALRIELPKAFAGVAA